MARWEVILVVRKLKEIKEESYQIGDYDNKKEAINAYNDVSNAINKAWPK